MHICFHIISSFETLICKGIWYNFSVGLLLNSSVKLVENEKLAVADTDMKLCTRFEHITETFFLLLGFYIEFNRIWVIRIAKNIVLLIWIHVSSNDRVFKKINRKLSLNLQEYLLIQHLVFYLTSYTVTEGKILNKFKHIENLHVYSKGRSCCSLQGYVTLCMYK